MHIISIYNLKGGSAKTTTAVNLSHYLTNRKNKTLLLDLDPQGHASAYMGVYDNATSTYDLMTKDYSIKDIAIPISKNFDVIYSNLDLAVAEIDLINRISREYILKKKLNESDYDFVIIDCPPSLGLLTLNALAASSHVIIPVQAEFFAIESLTKFLGSIGKIKEACNPELAILGFLLTQYDSRVRICKDVSVQMNEAFPGEVFKTIIRRNSKLAESPSAAQSIFEYDKNSNGAKDYTKFGKEVLTLLKGKKDGSKKRNAK